MKQLRPSLRLMQRTPGFTATAVLVLALGIGGTTSIFHLINVVILKPLPVYQPRQLLVIKWHASPSVLKDIRSEWSGYDESASFSYPAFELLQSHNQSFSTLFGFAPLQVGPEGITIQFPDHTSAAQGEAVTGKYFEGLGIQPLAGRLITPLATSQDQKVLVISHSFWTREFGRDFSAIGRTVFVGSVKSPYTIIGVTPPEFRGIEPGRPPDFWLPVSQWPSLQASAVDSRVWWLTILARRKPHTDRKQAVSELELLFQQSLPAEALQKNAGNLPQIEIVPCPTGLGILQKSLAQPLLLLICLAGLVLIIACANVAVLILGKSAVRRREMAVKVSLGAPRAGLALQVLVESFLLSSAGGLLGAVFGFWGARGLTKLATGIVGPLGFAVPAQNMDLNTAAFCIGLAMLSGVLAGVVPAWRVAGGNQASILRELGNDSSGAAGRLSWLKLREALVVTQVAISLLVIIASGLFLRTLEKLAHEDLGFVPQKILLFSLDGRQEGYQGASLTDFYNRFLQRLENLPRVTSATASTLTMISPLDSGVIISVEGRQNDPAVPRQANLNLVGPNFFHTMGIRVLSGRGIDWNDMNSARRLAVVNDSMRRQFFTESDIVGRHFGFGGNTTAFEIVGVVEDSKYHDVKETPSPRVYVPFSRLSGIVAAMPQGMFFEVRTNGALPELIAPIRHLVHELGPKLVIRNLISQEDQISASLSRQRILAELSGSFGAFVLLLTSIGLYGMQSYSVAQRTREIGIRLALGAQRKSVLLSVLCRALLLVGAGIALGLSAALGLSRVLISQLYGVVPNDPLTMIMAIFVFVAVALLAGYMPARKATLVDPAITLRHE